MTLVYRERRRSKTAHHLLATCAVSKEADDSRGAVFRRLCNRRRSGDKERPRCASFYRLLSENWSITLPLRSYAVTVNERPLMVAMAYVEIFWLLTVNQSLPLS